MCLFKKCDKNSSVVNIVSSEKIKLLLTDLIAKTKNKSITWEIKSPNDPYFNMLPWYFCEKYKIRLSMFDPYFIRIDGLSMSLSKEEWYYLSRVVEYSIKKAKAIKLESAIDKIIQEE